MTVLIWKNLTFKWINKVNKAFKKLKTVFISVFIFMQFNLNRETIVKADLSEYAIKNLFLQYDDNKILKSCAYFFK